MTRHPVSHAFFVNAHAPGEVSQKGQNNRRESDFAQPLALKEGDELANGWRLRDRVINTVDGASILFEGGIKRYVPQRLPLQLGGVAAKGVLPQDLRVGDVLQTGCVVLADPEEAVTDAPFSDTGDQYNMAISLSGGARPQTITTARDLHLARYGTLDDLDPTDSIFRNVTNKLAYLRRSILLKALNGYAIIDTLPR